MLVLFAFARLFGCGLFDMFDGSDLSGDFRQWLCSDLIKSNLLESRSALEVAKGVVVKMDEGEAGEVHSQANCSFVVVT
jgi:hypothetical protein